MRALPWWTSGSCTLFLTGKAGRGCEPSHAEETKKPRARARGFHAKGRTRGSEAAVARTGLALQIEADVGIRIGAQVLVADDHVLAVLRCGLGHDRRGERGRERRKSDEFLHDVSPVL